MNQKTEAPWGIANEDSRSIFYINIISALLILLIGVWGSTQYIAYYFQYQDQLGESLFILFGIPIYKPWLIFEWTYYYETYSVKAFFNAYLFIYIAFGIEAILLVYIAVWRAKNNKAGDAYGTARWSTEKELEDIGLLSGEGVVIGATVDGRVIQHNGPENVLAFAPPRSGKGVGLAIPTLLAWLGSVIVNDRKRELWEITSGFRKKFSRVLRFEPSSPSSIHFNPMLEIRKGDNEFRDAHNIAEMIIQNDDPNHKSDHWERTGKALILASILHVLYVEKDKSIPGVATFLSDPNRSIVDTLVYMMTCLHLGNKPHPIIASLTREVLNKSVNELSGVISTVMGYLTLYRDPVIANNIRDSDFSISDLMSLESPISLYLTVPDSEGDRMRPLIRLILNQIGKRLTESMSHNHSKPNYVHKLLLMLDEFPTLGKMAFLESALAFFPGYGIKAYLIAQSLNQIEKQYGPNNSILDTSHVRITYGSLDEKTAKRISDLLGESTQVRKMANYAGSRLAPWLGHVMVSVQESPRPLLTSGEILNMPSDANLILIGGMYPYYGSKITYYNDHRFKDKAEQPAPNSSEEQAKELPPKKDNPWENMAPIQQTNNQHNTENTIGNTHEEGSQDNTIDESLINPNEQSHDLDINFQKLMEINGIEDEDEEINREEDLDLNKQATQLRLSKVKQLGVTRELSRDESGGGFPL